MLHDVRNTFYGDIKDPASSEEFPLM